MCVKKNSYLLLLTSISLASFLWDIGKQNSPRFDASKHGVPSGTILFAGIKMKRKMKNYADAPQNKMDLSK